LGLPYRRVRAGLAAAAAAARAVVRGFGDMTAEEVADLTGLSVGDARAARAREYSESFVLHSGDLADLQRELRRQGLHAVRGGRFLTASGRHDKGTAVRAYLAAHPAVSWGV